ncbi:MAG: SRPBCC family protein [Candidatus Saccharibacteria bacterium]|nr:SRPBCC family protein [Moraxellaceae bacterium]
MTIFMLLPISVIAILAFAVTRPNAFRIERSILIQAPPDKIFYFINDFHQWQAWSPWEKIDPTMQRIYSGTPQGIGTIYDWEGKGKSGAGRMEITESRISSEIFIQLDFIKPFKAHNIAEFRLIPEGQYTELTWSMHGPSPYISKLMGIFLNIDRTIGKDFEKGLNRLKQIIETHPSSNHI